MWAGSLSHNGLTGCGTGGGDWACHQLEHELGGRLRCHPRCRSGSNLGQLGSICLSGKSWSVLHSSQPIYSISPAELTIENTALAGIEAMEDFFRSIHMPTNLHELGLDLTEQNRFMNWLSNAVSKIHVPLASSNS